MLRSVKNLLDVARGQLGYCEKKSNANLDSNTANAGSNNYTKYARDLYKAGYYQASKQGHEWCDMFVDWCFYTLCGNDPVIAQKMIFQNGPYGAGCKWSAMYYKNAGRFHESNPQPGDQIFFRNFGHTGIVESISNGIITTIEGNASNKVKRCTYPINSSKIDGYGRPEFEEEPVEIPPVVNDKNNKIEQDYTEYTVKPGDSWWRIAANELGDGELMDELAKFNGTTIAKVLHPNDVIKIPVENEGFWIYTVERGDSWWGLAEEYMGNGMKMHELAEFNGTTIAKVLHPNDTIKIPVNETKKEEEDTDTIYTVKAGDSWWRIAAKFMGNGNLMYKLAKYNGKTVKDVLHPKDIVKIPN